jgi:uncharacterized protein (DUF58 family)
MRPTQKLIITLLAWTVLGLAQGTLRTLNIETSVLSTVWLLSAVAIAMLFFVDYFSVGKINNLQVSREIASSQALGSSTKSVIYIKNTLTREIELIVAEAPNRKLKFSGLPINVILGPSQSQGLEYSVTPIGRGNISLTPVVIRVKSRHGLWDYTSGIGEPIPLKIYPNFAPIAHMTNLGIEQQVRQLGVHLSQRRGDGMEFKQLREFSEGDSIRQIDWKATARYQKPISREYQDEKNQEIYFLLDCGRRLRHKDDDLSHFDHSLNAILLTAYIAIRQGDACGFSTYSGPEKWLNPVQGNTGINALLNTLYDLESTTENTDFLKLAESFTRRNRRRSLVIIVSNIRQEDHDDLIQATRMLSKNHVVLVASLKEASLVKQLDNDTLNFDDALTYAETHQYLNARKQLIKKLRSSGVHVIDTLPNQLHIQLVTEYFRLKRSHSL